MNGECTHMCESCRYAAALNDVQATLAALTDAANALGARADRLEEEAAARSKLQAQFDSEDVAFQRAVRSLKGAYDPYPGSFPSNSWYPR